MGVKRNVVANYTAQIYITIIGIVVVPLYLRHMGAEAYGLVGFFSVMQAWFNLLDLGLTPTLARETARYRGGAIDGLSLRRLLRAMEGIFIAIAVLGAGAVIAFSGFLAENWLNAQALPSDDVQNAILIMAIILSLRWISALYRAAINGYERQVWLAGFNISLATFRFLGVLPVLIFIEATPRAFFLYQLIVAVAEVTTLAARVYQLMPRAVGAIGWSIAPIRKVLNFSLTLAFTSSVWVIVTQIDKLLLSRLLSLTHFAYFTAAVLAAGSVIVVGGPVGQAVQPHLAKLAAEGNERELIRVYRRGTQLVAVVVMSVSLTLAAFAERTLWAWTGDAQLVAYTTPVLALYAMGNGILALSAFPYFLQFAKGDVRLHMIGNILFLVLLVPALIWATTRYGARGAGTAWLAANLAYFLFWIPLVHRRLAPGLHLRWLTRDILPSAFVAAVAAILMATLLAPSDSRLMQGFQLAFAGGVVLLTTAWASSIGREMLYLLLNKRLAS